MDVKTQLRMLVQQIVEAYIKEKSAKNMGKRIVILLGYQSPNPPEVLQAIHPLLMSYNITFVLSKEWQLAINDLALESCILIEESTQPKLLELINDSDVLVIPTASYQLLSKLALTIDDELAVWLAIHYQLQGKSVVIANNYVEPNVFQQIHAPHSLQQRLQSYIRQIQVDQVKWVPLSKLVQTVEEQITSREEKQFIVLAKHVEKANRDGLNELLVPMKSKVTPSAKDLAKELKIHINKTDS